ncbi:NADH dehydrogenase [ubiquinone] 1 alpha subcomplex assembly factor 5 [Cladochytrium tenue]|nr:NADH dehydrogenase [ubiquinone] 1 alpha subcomplex assembly factor 5 [Cladochytrium tenue]
MVAPASALAVRGARVAACIPLRTSPLAPLLPPPLPRFGAGGARPPRPVLACWQRPVSASAAAHLAQPQQPSPKSAQEAPRVFDRTLKVRQRNRAATMSGSRQADYLRDEIADRMVDRLLDIKRKFNKVLDIGSGAGHIIKFMEEDLIGHLTQLDSSVPTDRVVGDEELLPFEENTFDCIMSSLSLHWVNDLPGALIQARRCLKPDGVFIGAMLGGETLYELRTALQLAELERTGGFSPRVSPMAVDVDEVIVNYPSMFELLYDLRLMGETNAVIQRLVDA